MSREGIELIVHLTSQIPLTGGPMSVFKQLNCIINSNGSMGQSILNHPAKNENETHGFFTAAINITWKLGLQIF